MMEEILPGIDKVLIAERIGKYAAPSLAWQWNWYSDKHEVEGNSGG